MDIRQHFTKTRIAPTPSGFLHLGNVFSFALTAWIAEQTGASVLLRIDDLDRQRVQPAYVKDIFETLRFMEIPWQQGPRDYTAFEREYSQLHRLPLYNTALEQLREKDVLFACNCSRTQLQSAVAYPGTCMHKAIPLTAEQVNWRLKTDAHNTIRMRTMDETMDVRLPDAMQDFVVRKKDGYAAYQLASVVDDLYFGVDFIVRGKDLLDSTLAQLYLAAQLPANQFAATCFYHHVLLAAGGAAKLSKSAGATSVKYLRESGKKARDIYAMIAAMLGITLPADNWQTLAAAYFRQQTGAK